MCITGPEHSGNNFMEIIGWVNEKQSFCSYYDEVYHWRKDRYIGPALYSMLIRKDLGDSPQNEVSFGETKQTNPDPGVRWYNEKNSRLIVESLSTICDIPAPCCT